MSNCFLHCLLEIIAQSSLSSLCSSHDPYKSLSGSIKLLHPTRGGSKTLLLIRTLCCHKRLFLTPERQEPSPRHPMAQEEEGLCLWWVSVLTDRSYCRCWLLLCKLLIPEVERMEENSASGSLAGQQSRAGFLTREAHIWKEGEVWKVVLVPSGFI